MWKGKGKEGRGGGDVGELNVVDINYGLKLVVFQFGTCANILLLGQGGSGECC